MLSDTEAAEQGRACLGPMVEFHDMPYHVWLAVQASIAGSTELDIPQDSGAD